jgi:hypothetical protein
MELKIMNQQNTDTQPLARIGHFSRRTCSICTLEGGLLTGLARADFPGERIFPQDTYP